MKNLFGNNFVDSMVSSAKTDLTIASLHPKKKAPKKQYNTRNKGGDAASYRGNRGGGRGGRGSRAGRGGGYGRGRGGNQNKRYESFLDLIPLSPPYIPHDSLVGGRIQYFVSGRSQITDDPWILKSIKDGLTIDFFSVPYFTDIPSQIKMSSEMENVCAKEVDDLLAKGAITEISDGSSGFVSSYFCVAKSDGGFRPITNLKGLNFFIAFEIFKMERLGTVRELLRQDDWVAKIDLKDAYLTVPMNPSFHPFLRFMWKGRIFQYKCILLVFPPSPRYFTKLLKVVAAYLRGRGIRLVIYLDDILLMNESKDGLLRDIDVTISLLQSLGFLINWKKSVVVPSQEQEYLGVIWRTNSLSCFLPSRKVETIRSHCSSLLEQKRVKLCNLAAILGSFTWASSAVPYAQAHFRCLQSLYIRESSRCEGDLSVFCTLSDEARSSS